MPVQRKDVASRCMDWPHVTAQREDRRKRETRQADSHVERMETYERKIRRSKQVRVYRQTIDVDQTVPLDSSPRDEDGTDREREEPPAPKAAHGGSRYRID